MRKATRIVVGGSIALLLVIVALAFVLVRNLDALVAAAIEDVGSRVTGTPVRVARVEIALGEARGDIEGLTVANPEGFDAPEAMRVAHAGMKLDPGSLGQEVIRIRELTVDGASLTAEILADGRLNLKLLRDRLDGGEPEPPADAHGTRLVIERFAFTNAELNLVTPLGREYRTPLAPIRLEGIGERAGGAAAGEAARQILAPVLASAARAARRKAAEEGLEGFKDEAVDRIREKLGLGGS